MLSRPSPNLFSDEILDDEEEAENNPPAVQVDDGELYDAQIPDMLPEGVGIADLYPDSPAQLADFQFPPYSPITITDFPAEEEAEAPPTNSPEPRSNFRRGNSEPPARGR